MNKTGFIYHDDFTNHLTGTGHPERPERLNSLLKHLRNSEIYSLLQLVEPVPADIAAIKAVHPGDYYKRIQNACKNELHYLDSDTVVCASSFEIALLAAGGGLEACRAVMDGRLNNAFCAVRPPGHHAEPTRAMGFCLFNNVAVAAKWLQHDFNVAKICIIDWDVHHGNGTQAVFYDEPTVLYISLHQQPLYPGTGGADETGSGDGVGKTINLPVHPGSQDEDYVILFEEKIVPAVQDFQPDFILISAGFDAHARDPLANIQLSESGFAKMTGIVLSLADENCDGKVVSFLEGGYDLEGLALSVEAHLEVLLHK